MKSRLSAITALLLIGLMFWWFRSGRVTKPVAPVASAEVASPTSAENPAPTDAGPGASTQPQAAQPIPGSSATPFPAAQVKPEPPRLTASETLNNQLAPPPPEGMSAVESAGAMLRDYRTLFGQNPEGNNTDIMKSLMGGNAKGAILGPPPGMSVNAQGELVDQWGTPIFFHAMSANEMEIRSAGPDGVMWNGDDVVRK